MNGISFRLQSCDLTFCNTTINKIYKLLSLSIKKEECERRSEKYDFWVFMIQAQLLGKWYDHKSLQEYNKQQLKIEIRNLKVKHTLMKKVPHKPDINLIRFDEFSLVTLFFFNKYKFKIDRHSCELHCHQTPV